MVFDADIYKADGDRYLSDLEEMEEVARVAVTYPSFELFLILHVKDAVDTLIRPHEKEILENGYTSGHKRFIYKFANESLGLNTKTNADGIAKLVERFNCALFEEEKLNQDPYMAVGTLTSNVAASIQRIIEEGA